MSSSQELQHREQDGRQYREGAQSSRKERTIHKERSLGCVPDPELLSSDEVEVLRVEVGLGDGEKLLNERTGGDERQRPGCSVGCLSKSDALDGDRSRVREELEDASLGSLDQLGGVNALTDDDVDEGLHGVRSCVEKDARQCPGSWFEQENERLTKLGVVGEDDDVGQSVVLDLVGSLGREGDGRGEDLEDLLGSSVHGKDLLGGSGRLDLALEEPGLERVADDPTGNLGLDLDGRSKTGEGVTSSGRVLSNKGEVDERKPELGPENRQSRKVSGMSEPIDARARRT